MFRLIKPSSDNLSVNLAKFHTIFIILELVNFATLLLINSVKFLKNSK